MSKQQPVALFDLDYTLLEVDSEALWCRYLFEMQWVDAAFVAEVDTLYWQYQDGTIDLPTYLQLFLAPLVLDPLAQMLKLREDYLTLVRDAARPYMLERLNWHRAENHTLVMITTTNSFLARPIAQMLGFPNLICTELQVCKGNFTGEVSGVPAFRYGKAIRLAAWLREKNLSLAGSWFYSGSRNDLPLLKMVDYPVMVEPDNVLQKYGLEQGWETLVRDDRETCVEDGLCIATS